MSTCPGSGRGITLEEMMMDDTTRDPFEELYLAKDWLQEAIDNIMGGGGDIDFLDEAYLRFRRADYACLEAIAKELG